jgi:biotin operon repressor
MTKFWTPKRDSRLLSLKAQGKSATEVADILGTSRGAVLGRLYRLQGIVFKSEKARSKQQREFALKRRRAAAVARRAAVNVMRDRIGWGMPRNEAMALASRDGLSFQAIGSALGISRQAAYKAVARSIAI